MQHPPRPAWKAVVPVPNATLDEIEEEDPVEHVLRIVSSDSRAPLVREVLARRDVKKFENDLRVELSVVAPKMFSCASALVSQVYPDLKQFKATVWVCEPYVHPAGHVNPNNVQAIVDNDPYLGHVNLVFTLNMGELADGRQDLLQALQGLGDGQDMRELNDGNHWVAVRQAIVGLLSGFQGVPRVLGDPAIPYTAVL